MSLGGDLIASVSSGRALCGTFVGGSNEEIGSKPAFKRLLRPPDASEFMAPDQACKKESLFYSNIHAGESHCEAVENYGWSAAVKLSEKKICSGQKTSEAYHMEYLYVPKKSFSIPRQQMRLSDEALTDLRAVQTLTDAEFFLRQYNSHVSTGRYHVGGVLMKSVKIWSKSKTSVQTFLDKFSRHSNSGAEISYVTVKGGMNVILGRKAKATATATYTAIGPQTDDEEIFMAGLTDKSTWAIIDTSDGAELIPVWEIASVEASVHPESCALLRLAWQGSIVSLPEITGRLNELLDQSYRKPFPKRALGDSSTESEVSSPSRIEEASALDGREVALAPDGREDALAPFGRKEISAPDGLEEASALAKREEATPPIECEEATSGGELDESGDEDAPNDNRFENHSTFVQDGAIHDTSSKPIKPQLPLKKAENLGFDAALRPDTAAIYQGILKAVDSGGVDTVSNDHKSDRCAMDDFQVTNELPGFQENQVVPSEMRSCVYRLMQIKLDKQDLSFVEKVTLLQGEIHNLCNRIVPNSVRNLGHDKYRLSFSQLNNSALQVFGFYGNKTVMMDVFRTKHIVDHNTLELMAKGELPPGLYATLRDETMHVFYWHDQGHGRTMSVASRKDISCNFIRYLVELCDVVHICLESDGLRPLLTASKSTLATKKRTQRLKISVVKATENDLKFLPGWEKELPWNGMADPVDIMLTEGYSRAALLVATPRPLRMSRKTKSKTVSIKEVPKLVASWQTKHNLDARDLDDKDFAVLLEYAQLEGYEGLDNLKETWKEKLADQGALEYKIDERLTREQLRVLDIFERGVSSYLKQHFPWDEGLLSKGSRPSMNPPDKLQLQEAGIERAVCEFWAGAHGGSDQQLIFCGSEISFISLNDGHDKADAKYSVHFSSQDYGGFKRFGPLVYGEEYILKRIEMSEESQVIKLLARDGVCSVGHVLTGQPLSVKYSSWKSKITVQGVKVHKRPCSDPVDTWMQSLAAFHSLQHRASLIQRGLTQLRNRAAEENISIDQDEKVLINAMLTGNFNAIHPSIPFLENDWLNLLVEDSPVQEPSSVSPAVEAECVEIHERNRDVLTRQVSDMVKKNIYPLLRDKIKTDFNLQKKELEEQGNTEESKYIRSIRQVFDSQFKKDLPTLSLRSCKYSQYWLASDKLTITYSKEVQEKENLTWNAIELALLKKDLEAQHTNATHVLIPNVHPQVHLMDMDSKHSRLSKVVYLRSGSVLVFVEQCVGDPLLSIFLCPKLGADLSRANPKKILRKRVDLVAFDEGTRFLAVYAKSETSTYIDILFFDETYSHLESTGIQTNLKEYNLQSRSDIVWMRFVPGKRELVVIDSLNCARVLELTQTPMFRARHIDIPFDFTKVCISADGSCLIVLHSQPGSVPEQVSAQDDMCLTVCEEIASSGDDQQPPRDDEPQMLTFEVYWLETMTHLKRHDTSKISVCNVTTLEATVVIFGTQMHLLIHDRTNPSFLYSTLLESSSASEVCEMQVQGSSNLGPMQNATCDQRSCPELDFVYHIFDKYATSPPLINEPRHQTEREVVFDILLKGSESDLGVKCENYVNEGLEKLKAEKAKDFSGLAITLQSQSLETWLQCSDVQVHGKLVPVGRWIQLLMCLVPIQIARAENNGLKPLVDGLQIPSHLNYSDALSLAGMIRFGFYESMLEGWVGDIKVISSMGKQSSGKSYLLNHLSGSLLDVAGGRCTDGVWMTVRPTKDCLYILLDFEGLGSFERSEQEDMLLSIFNAAVSNITIFNKKDFHLDKETEAVFEKFQSGVSLVKEDSKLFQGLFYIAIKDVDTSDVEDLEMEFQKKILHICSKSKQNFLTSMYGGEVEIAAMPPFQRLEYHDSIKEIASTVRELVPSHHNGLSFMRDLKLVLAQISAKDWSPIDSKRVAFKLCLLRQHWESAISLGCLAADESSATMLINFDTGERISELISVQVGPHDTFDFEDTGLQLAPPDLNQTTIEMVLNPLRTVFQNRYPRNSEHDEAWHSLFESFLAALAGRRKERVLEWIRVNTLDFEKDGDVQKLRLEALVILASLQQRLALCSCKCPRCFLRCIQERSHPGDHSCRTDHKCTQSCTYCADDGIPTSGVMSKCSDSAGHEGPHDCQEKAHTCGMDCLYLDQAANCNRVCTGKVKHTGDHKCNSRQHMCRSACSLPRCKNPCVIPFEFGDHSLHACHEKQCLEKCTVQGCNRNCASKDHFHSQVPGLRHHFCGDEHPCPEKCDAQGICEILTEVVKKTRTFQGIRSTFEYEHVSEQNDRRKACCIPIPPNEEAHQGPHLHTANKDAVHFCETRCHACGYFCNLPIGHSGSHSTTHGNMKDVYFVSESEEIDIGDRKYSWGESGQAEMCMMHCKNQGRGHIHLIPCLAHEGGVCAAMVIEGARHETCKYGPDVDIPKDELTHAAFWKHVRFKDPCSEDDGRLFALCNHQCRSSDHNVVTATGSQQASYCVEPLWHTPLAKVAGLGAAGYITDDGHHFTCDHSKNAESHVVFVIDRSISMDSTDCVPTMAKFTARHRNRLGCVYESILRFIRARQARIVQDFVSVVLFESNSFTAIDSNPIAETLVDLLLPHVASGGTKYSAGIRAAGEILVSSATNLVMQKKSPVVIFLSDGEDYGREDPVELVKQMKQVEPKLIFHTIKFGHDPCNQILMDMASAGSGTFQVSLDEVELARTFEDLALSLKDKVASLM